MIMLANFVDFENRKAENVHRPGGGLLLRQIRRVRKCGRSAPRHVAARSLAGARSPDGPGVEQIV